MFVSFVRAAQEKQLMCGNNRVSVEMLDLCVCIRVLLILCEPMHYTCLFIGTVVSLMQRIECGRQYIL